MTARNIMGIGMIAAVLAIAGWFIAVSPGQQAAIRVALRNRPPAIACTWAQPWADPAYVLTGWSQPQAWWHQPDTKVLWSNSRNAEVLFRLPSSLPSGAVNIDIKYAAVSAPTTVWVNGKQVGELYRKADGDHESMTVHYRLPEAPADGFMDVQFLVQDAVLHENDGRYLGVLLQAMRACAVRAEGSVT
jgi:hypothetical protein